MNRKMPKKAWKEDTPELMKELRDYMQTIEDFTSENLQESVKSWIKNKEIGFGKVMMPLRLALVGALQGPDLYVIAEKLAKPVP